MKSKYILTGIAISITLLTNTFGEHHQDVHDHAHHGSIAGPNKGRFLHKFSPHAEFKINDQRKVEIRFYNHDGDKQLDASKALIKVILGERSKPTKLEFEVKEQMQVSTTVIPEGKNMPVIIQIKADEDAEKVTERFQLNLADCPSCDNLEYACACDHHDH